MEINIIILSLWVSLFFEWAGLGALKQDTDGIHNTENIIVVNLYVIPMIEAVNEFVFYRAKTSICLKMLFHYLE